MASRISVYTLCVMRNEDFAEGNYTQGEWDNKNQVVHDIVSENLSEVEGLINAKLPYGFYCKFLQ